MAIDLLYQIGHHLRLSLDIGHRLQLPVVRTHLLNHREHGACDRDVQEDTSQP